MHLRVMGLALAPKAQPGRIHVPLSGGTYPVPGFSDVVVTSHQERRQNVAWNLVVVPCLYTSCAVTINVCLSTHLERTFWKSFLKLKLKATSLAPVLKTGD